MTSNDLTKFQLQTLHNRLFPGINYLYRLKDRLRELGISHEDELHAAASEAYEASRRLYMLVHHLSVHDRNGNLRLQ